MFLFFMLLLQVKVSGAVRQQVSVRAGDDVTLSCENVIKGRQNCDTTVWIYSDTSQSTVELFHLGQIKPPTSDRLSLTSNCSLVIKNVTAEDVGFYTCRQFVAGQHQAGSDTSVQLSVVHLTEQQNQNEATFSCVVSTDKQCRHKVRWLFKDTDVDKNHPNIKTSSSSCSAAAIVQLNHFLYEKKKLFKCEVKTDENKVQLFTFSSHPSDEETTTTTTTTKRTTTTSVAGPAGGNEQKSGLWLHVVKVLVVVAFTIIIITLIVLKTTEGKKTQKYSNQVCNDEDDGAVNYENIRTSAV